MNNLTWEQAVMWLREQPEQETLVRACYYDDPLLEAAQRFAHSPEWAATQGLTPRRLGRALDLGAGRGISSYALARDGWQVMALEPDPSPVVGSGAIRQLAEESGLPIQVVSGPGEALPFDNASFDLVYGRQVLHHACNLSVLCQEVSRVLKPGGRFIATREHVISKAEDLNAFWNGHPLHRLYGGENAYLLDDYLTVISESNLRLLNALGPFDSVINYFPMTAAEWHARCCAPLTRRIGHRATSLLTSQRHVAGRLILNRLSHRLSNSTKTPGRLYSFVAEKKVVG